MSRKKRRRNRLRHVRVETGGPKTPDVPFQGELMKCAMCGKVKQSDPAVESHWRGVQLGPGEEIYYVCPDHFPPDGGTAKDFERAYLNVLVELAKKNNGKSLSRIIG